MNKPKAHTSTVRGDAQLTAHIDVNRFMESTVSAQPQKFYRKEADHFFPEGCQCHDDSGSCDWCVIYYEGPTGDESQRRLREAGLLETEKP
jgi:hypothetical protein